MSSLTYWVVQKEGLIFSGNANNGSQAGSFQSNSNIAPSDTNTTVSSHLCLNEILPFANLAPRQKTTKHKKALVPEGENDFLKKQTKEVKRVSNIYDKVFHLDNLRLADDRARKGKRHSYGVRLHDQNREENLLLLEKMLKEKTFKTSKYEVFKIFKPKERVIYRLPYFPDRIAHHAIMNILQPIWKSIFTADTYSCIQGRGIHSCVANLKKVLATDPEGTKYCLKIDIKKFYPSIDHAVLKSIIRKKIKDTDLLWLLDEIIDSADGVPIGNYLSQYFANLYLAYFDHWMKEEKAVKHYFRYADDIVILAETKEQLHHLFREMEIYLSENLKLKIKGNHAIFPVEKRGIDFVGYVFWHTHTFLRKTIKKRFAKAMKKGAGKSTLAAYMGWAKHCDSKHLLKKLTA